MPMKKENVMMFALAAAFVAVMAGCNTPELARTKYGDEEQAWQEYLKQSYPSWKPALTEPPTSDLPEASAEPVIQPVVVEPVPAAGESRTYTVQKGDSLWKIADKFYGDGRKWKDIADANKGVLPDASKLKAGMVLTIPAIDDQPVLK